MAKLRQGHREWIWPAASTNAGHSNLRLPGRVEIIEGCFRDYIGITENKMETTGTIGFI